MLDEMKESIDSIEFEVDEVGKGGGEELFGETEFKEEESLHDGVLGFEQPLKE